MVNYFSVLTNRILYTFYELHTVTHYQTVANTIKLVPKLQC